MKRIPICLFNMNANPYTLDDPEWEPESYRAFTRHATWEVSRAEYVDLIHGNGDQDKVTQAMAFHSGFQAAPTNYDRSEKLRDYFGRCGI